MFKIKIIKHDNIRLIESVESCSLLDILRNNGYNIYAPCGGRGTCGKCTVKVTGEGEVISCKYYPDKNTEVILPGEDEASILVHQTEYLEDLPFRLSNSGYSSSNPYGVAIDIGTTTLVFYFLSLVSGQIEKISSALNPQMRYGADIITRINYCQEHENGLSELQNSVVEIINNEFDTFRSTRNLHRGNLERVVIAGNTTMLHLLLGEDPVSIALAPFKPKFTDKQIKKGSSTGLNTNENCEVITLPCLAAFIGADILAGLAALKPLYNSYLFLDIGTNGEIALVKDGRILACATAAGPAFEGANISCGMAAVNGAISGFSGPESYKVIGNSEPVGICGSGIVDIVAYLLKSDLIDETGLLKETFVISSEKKIEVTQQDIREIQLAKSAIYSGIRILMNMAGLFFSDIDALYLAGGFGNYINIKSAIEIGLLPFEMKDIIYPVGNSAVIGALQYLKSDEFEERINKTLKNSEYVELFTINEFPAAFALNMNFAKYKL
ncbi:MAG: DUF4445 domain-containing protein [Bacteroidales bacterium]|nr:DUF4445 domain-containing protein [Bacteroidales bacterium]